MIIRIIHIYNTNDNKSFLNNDKINNNDHNNNNNNNK